MDEARRQARAAAEKRRTLAKNSGKRLGGAPVLRGTDMRKLRADAAQRRIEVMNGCASGSDREAALAEEALMNGFRTKAEEDDANEQAILQAFIELIQEEEREKYGYSYVPPSQANPAGPRTQSLPPPLGAKEAAQASSPGHCPAEPSAPSTSANNSSYEAPWTCPVCTLENPPNFLCCDVCAAERPVPLTSKPPESQTRGGHSRIESQKQGKRPLQDDEQEAKEFPPARDTFAFKNRTRALDTLTSLERDANKRPLGWVCTCGTFMETQWWTCSLCGKMKPSS